MPMNEMRELIEAVTAASEAYYTQNREIMSDREYDALYDRLVALEKETGIVLSDSPTQKVGFDVVGELLKTSHETPLLSLDKTKNISDLQTFLGEHDGLLSWKIDGLTVALTYDNGRLIRAVTRGNGEIGEIITHNAKVFVNIPLTIQYLNKITVRGEAVITFADFERINDTLPLEEQYKNPRNLTSGTVRQLNSEICAARRVRYYAFGVHAADEDFGGKKENALKWLRSNFFETVEYRIVTTDTVSDEISRFASLINQIPYATDGLVLTYNDIPYSESLGRTSKFPKDSIAFKWRDETAETRLTAIEWNTSRTGLINPIAVFEPVFLEGSTVSRASLHNISFIENLHLNIGDTITVYKANMIIPQIAENLSDSGTVMKLPKKCPACGEESKMRENAGVKFLYCDNPYCRAKLLYSVKHFVSRDAMNIEGLSEAGIEKFIEKGFLNSYVDIYKLSRYQEEIVAIEGYGRKSFSNLISSIERSKSPHLPNFIYALGIPQIGLSNAKSLCAVFGGIDNIRNADLTSLENIEGFGEVISRAVYDYFRNEQNAALLDEALLYITPKEKARPAAQGMPLNGLIFVITGSVYLHKNRNELKDKIELNGGKVASDVSLKTSYLINNDSLSLSSKNKKAHELGIEIITEKELLRRFNI